LIATALTVTFPEVSDRRKWVVLVSPTANLSWSRTAVLAPMLAIPSMTVQYTPPFTMPHGVWCSGPSSMCALTRDPVSSSMTIPASAMNALA
jgi:hypothetical protein